MEQVETMARAMSEADGHDADALVTVSDAQRELAGDGTGPDGQVSRWRLYAPQARRLIAAQTALLDGS